MHGSTARKRIIARSKYLVKASTISPLLAIFLMSSCRLSPVHHPPRQIRNPSPQARPLPMHCPRNTFAISGNPGVRYDISRKMVRAYLLPFSRHDRVVAINENKTRSSYRGSHGTCGGGQIPYPASLVRERTCIDSPPAPHTGQPYGTGRHTHPYHLYRSDRDRLCSTLYRSPARCIRHSRSGLALCARARHQCSMVPVQSCRCGTCTCGNEFSTELQTYPTLWERSSNTGYGYAAPGRTGSRNP